MSQDHAADDGFAALADAALAGQRAATNDLLHYLKPRIFRYCRAKIVGSHGTFASADDVTQETLLAVFQALHTYRDTGKGFLAFVFGIAGHKVADFHRKNSRERKKAQLGEAPDVVDQGPGPEQLAVRGEFTGWMSQQLAVLPARQHEVIVLRYAAGLTPTETAAALSTTPGAVRVTQHRALTTLRRHIASNKKGETPCP